MLPDSYRSDTISKKCTAALASIGRYPISSIMSTFGDRYLRALLKEFKPPSSLTILAIGDAKHRIRIGTNNSPAQRVKTLAHELVHALLHEACDNRSIAELEAESTAYIVCQTLGIDSGNYSFGYCAG